MVFVEVASARPIKYNNNRFIIKVKQFLIF